MTLTLFNYHKQSTQVKLEHLHLSKAKYETKPIIEHHYLYIEAGA